MSDRYSIRLTIGDPIPRDALADLVAFLGDTSMDDGSSTPDWDAEPEQLIMSAAESTDGLLELTDHESDGDTYNALTEYLRDRGIAYDMRDEGDPANGTIPGGGFWRPGMEKLYEFCTEGYGGARTIPRIKVRPILDRLREARNKAYKLDAILKDFEEVLGPDEPELEPITIVEAKDGRPGIATGDG